MATLNYVAGQTDCPKLGLLLLTFRRQQMQEYRVYLMGPDGHIIGRTDLICEDDEAAKKQAQQLVDGHDVELSQGARNLVRFCHNGEGHF